MSRIFVCPDEKFFDILERFSEHNKLPHKMKTLVEEYNKCRKCGEPVDSPQLKVEDVKELYSILPELSSEIYLHELLQGAHIELTSPEISRRSPELEKRIQKLKLEQENRDYLKMTNNVDLQRRNKLSGMQNFSDDVKQMRSHMVAVINLLVTVGGSFFFGYKMVEYTMPTPVIAAQVLIGIILASIVALADLYFLLKKIVDEEEG